MIDRPRIEYGLWNVIPEGKTLDDVPQNMRWLYNSPFRTDYSKKKISQIKDAINDERERHHSNMDWRGEITTPCEMRERTITYSDWRKVEE